MKEHYCTYEQSVALKRLGFKEETTHYYVNFKSDGEIKLWSCNPPDNHNSRLSTNEVCSAPRLDQAAAWMREEKIFVGVNCENFPDAYISDMEPCYFPRIINLSGCSVKSKYWNDNLYTDEPKWFTTYEEALSAGIDKVLELLGKEVKK